MAKSGTVAAALAIVCKLPEDLSMSGAIQSNRQNARKPAAVIAFIAAFITASGVSWATPDGNLVVTLVPALAVGLVVFGIALWLLRRAHSE